MACQEVTTPEARLVKRVERQSHRAEIGRSGFVGFEPDIDPGHQGGTSHMRKIDLYCWLALRDLGPNSRPVPLGLIPPNGEPTEITKPFRPIEPV